MSDVVIFGILWIVFSVLGELGAKAWVDSAPQGSGPYFGVASNVGLVGVHAFDFLVWVALPIFVFVALMIVFSMVRFHVRKDSPATGDAPAQFRNNKAFVGIWVVASILINVLIWLHPNASGLETVFAAQAPQNNPNALVVDVTARQWEWIFSYPQYHITQSLNAAGQDVLYLPVNRPVKFVLRSYDPFHAYDYQIAVIHGFWIPAFGIKLDVVPGETRQLYLTPTKLTSTEQNPMTRVQCSEVCGPGHPYMEANVHVVTAAQFAAWVKGQQAAGN
ncbi:MAG: cytochrome c oxidase subunit II [Thermaerobacter sp.]|nr:cytochrome c oxidase subunit II [Thermaerobacter sp.]